MQKRYSILLLIWMGFSFHLLAQNREIDSLKIALKSAKSDTLETIQLNKIARAYLIIGLFDSTNVYTEKAIFLASKYPSYQNPSKIRLQKSLADAYNNLGIVCAQQARYNQALEYWQKALNIDESLGDKTGIASRTGNIGNIYWYTKDYEKALKYFNRAYALSVELNNIELQAKWLGNMGNVIRYQFENQENSEQRYQSLILADQKYLQAQALYHKINKTDGYARMLGSRSNIMVDLCNLKKAGLKKDSLLKIAFDLTQEALQIQISQNNAFEAAIQEGNLGLIYQKQGRLEAAKLHYKKVIDIFSELKSIEYLSFFYEKQARLLYEAKDYKTAFENFDHYNTLKDSVFNDQKQKELYEKELTYEFEKKEAIAQSEQDKKDLLSKIEQRKQKQILYVVVGVLGLILMFSLVLTRFFVQKKKANRILAQQNAEIQEQKEEIQSQNELVSAQKNRIEHIHKELTDSINYTKRLQDAILPTEHLRNELCPNHFLMYRPKDIVAGDFYWMEQVDDIVLMAVADCTGHGVPGAMVSMVCSNYLNKVVGESKISDPGKILDLTKDLVSKHFSKGESEVKDGMDISLCAFNKNDKTNFSWAGANNPLYLVRRNNPYSPAVLIEFKADKQPIGITDFDRPFTTRQIEVFPGDRLYLFSDGFKDQFGGENGKKLKSAPFKQFIESIQLYDMPEQGAMFHRFYDAWKSDFEQVDDVCIWGIEV